MALGKSVPQRLKPCCIDGSYGTAGAVPFETEAFSGPSGLDFEAEEYEAMACGL